MDVKHAVLAVSEVTVRQVKNIRVISGDNARRFKRRTEAEVSCSVHMETSGWCAEHQTAWVSLILVVKGEVGAPADVRRKVPELGLLSDALLVLSPICPGEKVAGGGSHFSGDISIRPPLGEPQAVVLVVLSWSPFLDTIGGGGYVQGVPAIVSGGIFTIEQGEPIFLDLWGKSVLGESIGHQELHNASRDSLEKKVSNRVFKEELILIIFNQIS